jgi:ankyrin repeat protein
LIYAAEKGKVEALELLLSKGANIEAAEEVIIFKHVIRVKTPVFIFSISHNFTVIFISHPLSHYFIQYGFTALMCAAEKGEVVTVELLLSKGANIEAADKVIIFK